MGLTSFERRLAGVLILYIGVQTLVFAFLDTVYHLPFPWNWSFYPFEFVYLLLMLWGLWSVRGHFRTLDGKPLQRLGLPNHLTLFRLTNLPLISWLFLLARSHPSLSLPLVILVVVAFLTDLLDGFLARTFRQGTQLGKVLDSTTDYIVLFSLTVVLGLTHVLETYLLVFILVRLCFQIIAVFWVQMAFGERFVETTWLGKASLFVLMVFFALEILIYLRLPGFEAHWAVVGFKLFTAVVMAISTIDKIIFFWRKMHERRRTPSETTD